MSTRVEGQLWIDKNSPSRLKYHINNQDFVVEVSSSYSLEQEAIDSTAEVGSTLLPAGLLVKLDKTNGISRASFPDDLENVLGVVTQDVKKLSNTEATEVIVGRNGYLTIDEPWNVFKELEGTDINSFVSKLPYKDLLSDNYGLPVYWYLGKTELTLDENGLKVGRYASAKRSEGKLTFDTPAGFKWDNTKDASLNVAYDNLPQIGTLIKIEGGKMYVHLNFSRFDSTIEWTWPGVHSTNSDCGLINATQTSTTQNGSTEILIRHGLFADSASSHKVRSFCDIIALDQHEPNNKNEYLIQAPVTNETTGDDRYTKITISSPESFYYRISGRINYKFDKGGN